MEQIKTNVDQDFIDYANSGSKFKASLATTNLGKFLIRAMMSGILLTFMYMTFYSVESLFEGIGTEVTNMTNLGVFYGSWIFSFALVFIYYSKSELLTSNMNVMTVGKINGAVNWSGFIKVLGWTYIGNALGGLFVAILILNTSVLTPDMQLLMTHSIEAKLSYVQSGFGGYVDLFVRALWCNFFINLGMLPIYGGMVKSDFGKALVIFGAIFVFMKLGLEHSVANTCFFILVAVTGTASVPAGIAIVSLIVALIGNFVGGGLLIGGVYAYLNK